MFQLGYPTTNLKNKCHECVYYRPLFKTIYNLKNIKTCRGSCSITGAYKQRTETCKKFKKESED